MDVQHERRRFAINVDQIAAGRDWCRTIIDGNDSLMQRRSDIELCVTELLANAIMHSTGDRIVSRTTQRSGTFEFRLASAGPMVSTPPWPPRLVDATAVSGRGLYLAYVLSDTFTLTQRANSVTATARFNLGLPDGNTDLDHGTGENVRSSRTTHHRHAVTQAAPSVSKL